MRGRWSQCSGRRFAAALATTVALSLLALATASAQVTDATLDVQAVDEQGGAVPGVTVTVKSASTGAARVVVTGEDGTTRVSALPAGSYSVQLELAGFAPIVEDNVVLRVGQTAKIIARMQLAKAAEEITVTAAAPVVDVMKADVSSNITPEQIEQLPTPDRDFQKLAYIAPGVTRERGGFRFITNAPVLGSGGNASQQAIIVDGVDFTDQALGLARARFSQDAIREFRVVTNRFDTEIGQSQGGALSVVTKSGGNEVQGSAFLFYRADALRTQGELETGDQDFSRYQAGFTIGGPIARDKTHYFASVEYIDEQNISPFRPLGSFASLAEDVEHPFTQMLFLGSLNHQIAANQTFELKAVADVYREENFRVGGIGDLSSGMDLDRDNWNFTAGHTWVIGDDKLNTLRAQFGQKKFDEPNNSALVSEYFSLGTTLITGSNIVGDQTMTGDYIELRDTFHMYLSGKSGSHDVKFGGSVQRVNEEWHYPLYPNGLLIWASDARAWAIRYDYAVGSPDLDLDTNLYGVFVQDDWKISPNFTLNLGVRYDYDSDGNNPDYSHPLEPVGRSADSNNYQPRLGFVWDVSGDGGSVVRGGVGSFAGRYLLVPSFVEQQQNGFTGRTAYTRLDGLFVCVTFGIPPAYCPFSRLNPADPEHTGVLLAPNIAYLKSSLEAPEATQASLGFTQRLGSTGLFLGIDGVWVEGDDEIVVRDVNFKGNAAGGGRPNAAYAMVNKYTNEGRSEYQALMLTLNGTIGNGHLINASVTYSDKKNISDDFSPALNDYPSDPADIEAEWGPGRGDERWRAVVSGVFRLPWQMALAPIWEYGSGQPWTQRLGYDYNGDGRYSDRPAGVGRNEEEGPDFNSFSLRFTKTFTLGGSDLDLIVEGFNLFDTTNYDVNSVSSNRYTAGPTISNPALAYVANPSYGSYTATLSPREIQVGLRYRF